MMPPGVPGRVEYNPLPGHTPGTTDPAKAKQLLQQAGKLGYEIKFAYQTDIPTSVATKDVISQALSQAGFKVSPVATTSANYVANFLTNPQADVNVRSVGWCSDWPSGSSWMPPLFQTTDIATQGFGSNYEAFTKRRSTTGCGRSSCPDLDKQPAAWNDLDKDDPGEVLPLRRDRIRRCRDDARVEGPRLQRRRHVGMPTWKDMWVG